MSYDLTAINNKVVWLQQWSQAYVMFVEYSKNNCESLPSYFRHCY